MTIKGYCQPLSAAPGEEIRFFVSTTAASFAVSIRDMSRNMLLKDTSGVLPSNLPGANQPVPQTPDGAAFNGCIGNQSFTRAAVNGCGWSESFRMRIPMDWASGMYTALCEENGNTEYI